MAGVTVGRPLRRRLTAASLQEGCTALAASDARLAGLLDRNGIPPLRLRPEGFATLAHLILQQQVSRASAGAVYGRLEDLLGGEVSAPAFLLVAPDDLRNVGLSRQKIQYVTELADGIVAGTCDVGGLRRLDDEAAIDALLAQRGIGPWTASVYVLTALGRPDVWAPGDRALLVSLSRMLRLARTISDQEAIEVAEAWRPWRAVAARILWHDYAAAGA